MNPKITKQHTGRFHSLDKLKVLCAFLVVCIHAPFPGTVGEYITALTRIGVPIFFMITGFFYRPSNIKGQIKKILYLLLLANFIYLLWGGALALMKGETQIFLTSTFTLKNLLKFLLLNESPFSGHLWYLGAILYTMLVVWIVDKHGHKKLLYLLTPFLLIGDLMLGKYSLILFHREFPYIIVRNWLFVGIPYFTVGMYLREKSEKKQVKYSNRKKILLAAIPLFVITTLLERFFLVSIKLNTTRDHYLSTTFLAIAVFLFFLFYVSDKENVLSTIGRRDSTWIYIVHPVFITILGVAATWMGIEPAYSVVRPIMVFIITAVFVYLIMKTTKRILHRNET